MKDIVNSLCRMKLCAKFVEKWVCVYISKVLKFTLRERVGGETLLKVEGVDDKWR